MTSTERYAVVCSTDSLPYFPENNPTRFTTLLSTPAELQGSWTIGLKQIVLTLSRTVSRKQFVIIDVFLNQASGCILNGQESTLLRRLHFLLQKNEKHIALEFDSCNMMPTKSPYLDRLEIVIAPLQPEIISFDPQTATHATLVLRKLKGAS